MRQCISVVLSPPVYGILLQQLQETITQAMDWVELPQALVVWLEAQEASHNSRSTGDSTMGTGVKNLQFRWWNEIRPSKIFKTVTRLFKTRFLCLPSFTPYNHTVNDLGRLINFTLMTRNLNFTGLNILAKIIYAHGKASIGAQSFLGRKNKS